MSPSWFVWFVLGIVYMDFRVDHRVLMREQDENDTVLGYAFTHYQVSAEVQPWYQAIFPIIMIAASIIIGTRVYKKGGVIDYLILILLIVLGGIFGALLIPKYQKMDELFKKSGTKDPFIYVYSSGVKNMIETDLLFIGSMHVIIIIILIIILFLLGIQTDDSKKTKDD